MAEIYTSRALRMLATSMTSIFVTIYLYQNGYSVSFIGFYIAAYFAFRALMTIPLSFVVARIGPKHATLISNVLSVPALLSLALLPEYGITAAVGFTIFQATSVSLNEVSYMVNLSKVKHVDHDGKEIGYLQIIDRIAISISPVIGGVIAFLFGPQVTLLVASGLFLVAALPLLTTPEPTKIHQKIIYTGLPLGKIWRQMMAESARGVDIVASNAVWSLFLAIAIFGVTDNSVYAEIGVLVAATVLVASFAARLYGTFIDHRRAGELMRAGSIANAVLHFFRPFVANPATALFMNITNELATIAYAMPFTKGVCDQAENLPGYRIAYLTLMNTASCLGAVLLGLVIGITGLYVGEIMTLQISFVVAGFYGMLLAANGLPALKIKR